MLIRIAAPVGVVSSFSTGPPKTGTFLRISNVAGAGMLIDPWLDSFLPPPSATGIP